MSRKASRRQFLGVAAAGLVGVTGCSQFQSSPEPELTTIVDAYINNRYPEPRELSISFERDGDLVYWRQFDVEANGANDDGVGSTDVPVEELSDEPSVWTVKVLNADSGNFRTATLSDDRSTEIRLKITIEDDDGIGILTGP